MEDGSTDETAADFYTALGAEDSSSCNIKPATPDTAIKDGREFSAPHLYKVRGAFLLFKPLHNGQTGPPLHTSLQLWRCLSCCLFARTETQYRWDVLKAVWVQVSDTGGKVSVHEVTDPTLSKSHLDSSSAFVLAAGSYQSCSLLPCIYAAPPCSVTIKYSASGQAICCVLLKDKDARLSQTAGCLSGKGSMPAQQSARSACPWRTPYCNSSTCRKLHRSSWLRMSVFSTFALPSTA